MNKIAKSRRIYMSIAAQPDNLGDIAIRQAAIEILHDRGVRLVVFAGTMPRDYIAAFGLPTDVDVVRSARKFAMSFIRDAFRMRAHLVFAPGPLQLRPGVRPAVKSAANLTNVMIARLSGGKVIALGRALRGEGKPALWIERAAISMYSLFSARDDVSAHIAARRLHRTPDLAFMRAVDMSDEGRTRVAISLRGDRETSRELIADVVRASRSNGLQPTFVTQVGRDEGKHRELAESFDADVVSWDGESHGLQLNKVERVYRTCQFVVSDRLHALILGMLKGAIPIAILHPNSDKLTSTLASIVTTISVAAGSRRLPDEAFRDIPARRHLLDEELSLVKERLSKLASEVQSLVR